MGRDWYQWANGLTERASFEDLTCGKKKKSVEQGKDEVSNNDRKVNNEEKESKNENSFCDKNQTNDPSFHSTRIARASSENERSDGKSRRDSSVSKTSRTVSECEADTRIHEVEDLVEDPEEISQLLRSWMRNLGRLHCDSVLDMWPEQGSPDEDLFVATDPYHGLQWDVRDEWGVEDWEGPVDARGRWHGRGVVRLAGGGEVAGTWRLGRREGRFSMTAPADGILSLVGGYRDGKLTGLVRIIKWVQRHGFSCICIPGKTIAWWRAMQETVASMVLCGGWTARDVCRGWVATWGAGAPSISWRFL